MLRHVVMMAFEDAASEADQQAIVDALRGLPERISAIASYSVGRDAGLSEGNFDLVLVADFADAEAFAVYQADAGHQQIIAELIKPVLARRSAVQYFVG